MARPRKYQTNKELENKINKYFQMCDESKETIKTEKTIKIIYKPYTVSGLCLYLDITRETLCQYEKMDIFSDTVKKAKTKIENWIEEHSLSGDLHPVVSIFNLKNNFGWKDKQEIEHSGGVKQTQEYHIMQEIIKDEAVAERIAENIRQRDNKITSK